MDFETLRRAVAIVGPSGGSVIAKDQEGKTVWERGLAPGRHELAELRRDMVPTDTLEAAGGVMLLESVSRIRRAEYGPEATHSGANPDFVPQRMTDVELRARRLMKEVDRRSDALERRFAAMEAARLRDERKEPKTEVQAKADADPPKEREAGEA